MLKVWSTGECEVEDHKDSNICVDLVTLHFIILV